MNVLALDTSTRHAALAVARADGAVFVAPSDPEERHGRALVPAIRDLLRESGLALADLDGLGVGLGPGSYTGLRVGVTAIKTLAYAANKPLVGLDSIEAVAMNAPADETHVTVSVAAQRKEVHLVEFGRAGATHPLVHLGPTRTVSVMTWLDSLARETYLLGPGNEGIMCVPAHVRRPDDPLMNYPQGGRLLELARAALTSGRRDVPWFLEPTYLRRSAAEDQMAIQMTDDP